MDYHFIFEYVVLESVNLLLEAISYVVEANCPPIACLWVLPKDGYRVPLVDSLDEELRTLYGLVSIILCYFPIDAPVVVKHNVISELLL